VHEATRIALLAAAAAAAAAATGCYSSAHLMIGRDGHAHTSRHWLNVCSGRLLAAPVMRVIGPIIVVIIPHRQHHKRC